MFILNSNGDTTIKFRLILQDEHPVFVVRINPNSKFHISANI